MNAVEHRYVSTWGAVVLAAFLGLFLVGCQLAPAPLPPQEAQTLPAPTPVIAPDWPMPDAGDLAALADQLEADLPLRPADSADFFGFDGVTITQVEPSMQPQGAPSIWLVHTHGMRPFDPIGEHFVALFSFEESGWQERGRVGLACADYVNEESVQPVMVEPEGLWLESWAGAGAHSGCFDLLRYDGDALTLMASNFNSTPDAGRVMDLDGDGWGEVILNYTEPYIFCYACGTRLYMVDILRWQGDGLAPVILQELADGSQAAALNDEAVRLARSELFKDAHALIEEALLLAPQNETLIWNGHYIRVHAENRLEYLEWAYPILGWVFYGDYAAAVDEMRAYSPAQIFQVEGPLIAESTAEMWEASLAQYLTIFAEGALAVRPDLAEAHFLLAWAAFLEGGVSPDVVSHVEQAARLAPEDPLFTASLDYLQSGP